MHDGAQSSECHGEDVRLAMVVAEVAFVWMWFWRPFGGAGSTVIVKVPSDFTWTSFRDCKSSP
jgi:hypothetical protein